ncbi:hypothetical protein GUITHDRAFT_150756, partial [Guillardia theta CCMP2712]
MKAPTVTAYTPFFKRQNIDVKESFHSDITSQKRATEVEMGKQVIDRNLKILERDPCCILALRPWLDGTRQQRLRFEQDDIFV